MFGMMEATCEVRISGQDCDQELVQQAREGSRVAFDALFTRHRHFVYSVCYRVLGTREDAVDATQSAFIRAYRALRGFRGDAAFRSWLYRIAINECRAALRRKRRARPENLQPEWQTDCQEPAEDHPEVHRALLQLPIDLRAPLVLFYFQGISGRELAQSLGCSEGAARVRLHRARAAFKRVYVELSE